MSTFLIYVLDDEQPYSNEEKNMVFVEDDDEKLRKLRRKLRLKEEETTSDGEENSTDFVMTETEAQLALEMLQHEEGSSLEDGNFSDTTLDN